MHHVRNGPLGQLIALEVISHDGELSPGREVVRLGVCHLLEDRECQPEPALFLFQLRPGDIDAAIRIELAGGVQKRGRLACLGRGEFGSRDEILGVSQISSLDPAKPKPCGYDGRPGAYCPS